MNTHFRGPIMCKPLYLSPGIRWWKLSFLQATQILLGRQESFSETTAAADLPQPHPCVFFPWHLCRAGVAQLPSCHWLSLPGSPVNSHQLTSYRWMATNVIASSLDLTLGIQTWRFTCGLGITTQYAHTQWTQSKIPFQSCLLYSQ